jgi:hypothetical protein
MGKTKMKEQIMNRLIYLTEQIEEAEDIVNDDKAPEKVKEFHEGVIVALVAETIWLKMLLQS